jgi:multidrug efflux pump subunit AcrA (membrane-fusion protein)
MNIVQEEPPRVTTKAPKVTTRRRTGALSIPRWAYVLFAVLAVVVLWRTFQRGVGTLKPPQTPARPVTVAKVVTKDVPLYLDEIGTCAAYETVLVQAQVSGVIMARHFQDGSDVKKGDPLFIIDPRPYRAALDQANAQAALDKRIFAGETLQRSRITTPLWRTRRSRRQRRQLPR